MQNSVPHISKTFCFEINHWGSLFRKTLILSSVMQRRIWIFDLDVSKVKLLKLKSSSMNTKIQVFNKQKLDVYQSEGSLVWIAMILNTIWFTLKLCIEITIFIYSPLHYAFWTVHFICLKVILFAWCEFVFQWTCETWSALAYSLQYYSCNAYLIYTCN